MSWEAVAAMSALLTALIIGITAILALVQVRHLRRATQLQAFLEVMTEAASPQVSSWAAYVEQKLPERMKDETYRRERAEGSYDFENHKELALGAFWEKIGTVVHFRLIEPEVFLDYAAATCPHHWRLLKDVAELRRRRNPRVWERFEELAAMCDAYLKKRQQA